MASRKPSVFISSTCYDLADTRAQIKEFIEALGYDPIFSESTAFPVYPRHTAIQNCQKAVLEKADIFVLIIGSHFGSVDVETGASITQLEYRHARAKGVPLYIFIHKTVPSQAPAAGDLSSSNAEKVAIASFVEEVRKSHSQWCFRFDHDSEIIATLKAQWAFLFNEALNFWTSCNHDRLHERYPNLSLASLKLLVEKPCFWEYRLLSQVLNDSFLPIADKAKDIDFGIRRDQVIELLPEGKREWFLARNDELLGFIDNLTILMGTVYPQAVGEPGTSGNADLIVYLANRLSSLYNQMLDWKLRVMAVRISGDQPTLAVLFGQFLKSLSDPIEKFRTDLEVMVQEILHLPATDQEPVVKILEIVLDPPPRLWKALQQEVATLR